MRTKLRILAALFVLGVAISAGVTSCNSNPYEDYDTTQLAGIETLTKTESTNGYWDWDDDLEMWIWKEKIYESPAKYSSSAESDE